MSLQLTDGIDTKFKHKKLPPTKNIGHLAVSAKNENISNK